VCRSTLFCLVITVFAFAFSRSLPLMLSIVPSYNVTYYSCIFLFFVVVWNWEVQRPIGGGGQEREEIIIVVLLACLSVPFNKRTKVHHDQKEKKLKFQYPLYAMKATASFTLSLMLSLLPSPSDGLEQICFCDLFPTREVPCGNLGVNLHARIRGNQMIRKVISR